MTTLLKNGNIYDGTGSNPFVSDILIKDDKIVSIGKDIKEPADKVIDVTCSPDL